MTTKTEEDEEEHRRADEERAEHVAEGGGELEPGRTGPRIGKGGGVDLDEIRQLDLHGRHDVGEKERVQPIAAAGNHAGEGEPHAGDRRGVEQEHDPRYPEPDDELDDRPHGEGAGHGDLDAGPDDDDGREPAPEGVAGGEDGRPVRRHDVVHDLVEKPFEVVQVFGRDVGGDGRVDLLLRQGGRSAQ